jgi:hypothetical protein
VRPRQAAVRLVTGWTGVVPCGGGDYVACGRRPPCLEGERCGGVGHVRQLHAVKEGREGKEEWRIGIFLWRSRQQPSYWAPPGKARPEGQTP